jgi:DNA-binding GntR family transcriptional regulator
MTTNELSLSARTTGERVAEYLRNQILAGRLRPEDRLVPDALVEPLGVSRMPIREAFLVLEHDGWISTSRSRRSVVNPIDAREVHDIFRVAGTALGIVIRRIIESADDAELAELVAAGSSVLEAETTHELLRSRQSFIAHLLVAASSPHFVAVLRASCDFASAALLDQSSSSTTTVCEGTKRIVEVLRTRDLERAEGVCLEAAAAVGATAVQLLEERGVVVN